jgi:diadenylate cyclase
MELISHFSISWKPVFEIAVFWFAYYLLLVYIKDSGMLQPLKGLIILGFFFFVAQSFEFKAIHWVLSYLFQISILGFLILFQPELRRGLMRIGQSPLFKLFLREEKLIDEIVKAVMAMSKDKTGALIAIERETGLKAYVESGIVLDAILTSELVATTFNRTTPLHDGGMIVQGNRVLAVGCLFPLSQSQKLSKTFGTRHRAGLGLSEETDALVIVVSEETGIVSLMSGGKITRDIDEEKLKAALFELYQPQKSPAKSKKFLFRRQPA